MPTGRGWFVVATGIVLITIGRVLGLVELYVLGASAVAAVVVSALAVNLWPIRIGLERTLRPARVHVGNDCRVELTVVNNALLISPVLLLRDPFSGAKRPARFQLAPIRSGASRMAAYRLPTERRGVFTLGPTYCELRDPLELTRRARQIGAELRLVVMPRIEVITSPRRPGIGDPVPSGSSRPSMQPTGELHSLRPYVVGDDMRRVHWASSARSGSLVVREDEESSTGRIVVVLDTNTDHYDSDAAFETAVSAAASVLFAAQRDGLVSRLLTTDHDDTGAGRGEAHLDAMLEALAATDRHQQVPGSLTATLEPLAKAFASGAVVVITGQAAINAATASITAQRGLVVGVCEPGFTGSQGQILALEAGLEIADRWRASDAVRGRS